MSLVNLSRSNILVKVRETLVSESPAGADVEVDQSLHRAELCHSELSQTSVGELPTAGDCEGGEVGQVLGNVSHAIVRDLGVLQAELL